MKPWLIVWDLDKTLVWYNRNKAARPSQEVFTQPLSELKAEQILSVNPGAVAFLKEIVNIRKTKPELVKYIFLLTNNHNKPYIKRAIEYLSESIPGIEKTAIFDAIMYFINESSASVNINDDLPWKINTEPRTICESKNTRGRVVKSMVEISKLIKSKEPLASIDNYRIMFIDDYPEHPLVSELRDCDVYIQVSPPFATAPSEYKDNVDWSAHLSKITDMKGGGFYRKRRHTHRNNKREAVGFDSSDIYALGSLVETKEAVGCVIETYNEARGKLLVKKITCGSVSEYNKIYKLMKKFLDRSDDKSGPQVVYSKICSDSEYKPVGFLVLKKLQSGGVLCKSSVRYTKGAQIGAKDQASMDDTLYVAKEDEDLLIKRLVGNSEADFGENYETIFNEINFTIKAGNLGVGPKVHLAQIVSDMKLRPIGHLVMDRIRGTYIKRSQVQEHRAEIKLLLDKLYDGGISHGDTHNRNIILGSVGNSEKKRIWIIDYGSAESANPEWARDYIVYITQESGDPHRMYDKMYVN